MFNDAIETVMVSVILLSVVRVSAVAPCEQI